MTLEVVTPVMVKIHKSPGMCCCVFGQVGPDNMAPHPGGMESSVLPLSLLMLHQKHENYKLSKYLDHTVIKQIGSSQYFVKKRVVSVNKEPG